MKFFRIHHVHSGACLAEGLYPRLSACAEDAVRDGVDLSGADFRGANLLRANLDGLHAHGAVFDGANLGFANLSEAALRDCSFIGANLQAACLCESVLRDCDFTGAIMDGADVAKATLARCRFSTWSSLRLNFAEALDVDNCLYVHEVSAIPCRFTRAPIVVTGFDRPIAILDSHIQLGGQTMPMPSTPPVRKLAWRAGPDLDANDERHSAA